MNIISVADAKNLLETKKCFITPVLQNSGHYVDNDLSFCIISELGSNDYGIIPFQYPKLPKAGENKLFKFLQLKECYSSAARYFLRFNIDVYDSELYRWYYSVFVETKNYGFFTLDKKGAELPITKVIEFHLNIKRQFEVEYFKFGQTAEYLTYFKSVYKEILQIEYIGIANIKSLTTGPEKGEISQILRGYHFFTSKTGRISYKTDNINLLSIPHDEGRRNYTSRYEDGYLAEFDFDGFHLRLIGSLLHDEFDINEKAHVTLAKLYLGKDTISKEEYEIAKQYTFQQLYHSADDSPDFEFFRNVDKFKKSLWDQYNLNGSITTPSGRDIIGSDIDNPGKLFSYYIQAYEVEISCKMLSLINNAIFKYQADVVLYVYDSFLIDFMGDKKIILEIFKLLKDSGYPVNVKVGKNYFDMVDLTDKLKGIC